MKKKNTLKVPFSCFGILYNFRVGPLEPHMSAEAGFIFWGISIQCLFCQSLYCFFSNWDSMKRNSSLNNSIRYPHGPPSHCYSSINWKYSLCRCLRESTLKNWISLPYFKFHGFSFLPWKWPYLFVLTFSNSIYNIYIG